MFFLLNDLVANNLYQNVLTDNLVTASIVSTVNSDQILLKTSLNSYYNYLNFFSLWIHH